MPHNFKPDLAAKGGRGGAALHGALCYGLALVLSGGWVSAAEKPLPPLPEFRRLAPLPSIRTATEVAKIALNGLEPPLERTTLQIGDQVTALVSLTEGADVKQWVIELGAVATTEKEKQSVNEPMVFHSSTGNVLRYGGERAALNIRTLGPLTATDAGRSAATAPVVKSARTTVDLDYLALGLHRPPSMAHRVKRWREENPGMPRGELQIRNEPFPAEEIARSKIGTDAVGVTLADERSIVGSLLALIQFFQVASQTPGLQEVLKRVIDVPWWSIIRSGGKLPGINFEMLNVNHRMDPALWGLRADAEVWSIAFVLHLNAKPAVVCQLAVVEPRPPLLPSAGIVGLAAGRPNGKGPVLTLQIVAARGAP